MLHPVAVTESPAEDWHDLVSMAVSMAVHVVALLLLAVFVPLEIIRQPAVQIISSAEEPEADFEEAEMLPIEVTAAEPENLDQPVPEVAMDVAAIDATDIDTAGTADPSDMAAFAGPLSDSTSGIDALLSEFGTVQAGGGPGGGGGFGGEIGRRLVRAGARSGSIQVSLSWNNLNDLDLHVVAPSGERVYFAFPRSNCGGHLDVDMNANEVKRSAKPVENVYWPRQRAPRGSYAVYVHHFNQHDQTNDTPFEVHVLVDGRKQSFKGIARVGQSPALVAEFNRVGGGTSTSSDDEFME